MELTNHKLAEPAKNRTVKSAQSIRMKKEAYIYQHFVDSKIQVATCFSESTIPDAEAETGKSGCVESDSHAEGSLYLSTFRIAKPRGK